MNLRGISIFTALILLLLTGSARAGESSAPLSITIATAAVGGTYHTYGAELSNLLSRALGIEVAERLTEGPSQNIQLIENGAVQIGFVSMGEALQGWNGTAAWANGRQFRNMRAIFPMYDTPFTFAVPKQSAIHALSEMAGKRIGVGPKGSTAGSYIPRFLTTLKVDATLVFGTYEELSAQLQAGKIDVLAAAAGAPFPALTGLEAKKAIRFVSLSSEEITALRLAMPELSASTIAAGRYPSLVKNYATVGLFNFAVAHKDLPDDLVYAIVDTVFNNQADLIRAAYAATETIPANFTRNTFLPFHGGAMRYFSSTSTRGIVQGD